MPNGNGDDIRISGGFGAPGQREITRRDEATEIRAPDQHAIRLFVALLVALATLGCVAVVLGPGLLFWGVIAAILYVAGRAIVGAAQRGRTASAWVMLFVTGALVAWGLWGWEFAVWFWPPVRVDWPVYAKAGVVMIAVFAFAPVLILYGYRRSYEIADPNHSSPRTAIERTKPIMPWSPETRDFLPDEPLQFPERKILHGVEVHERGQVRILALPKEAAEGELYVEAPSGQQIPASDLRAFVKAGPILEHGASFRTWSEREKWSHNYWGDVVETLAMLGIMRPREPRKATEFAIADPAEAQKKLEEFLGDSE